MQVNLAQSAAQSTMSAIAAAVTPVVMISANAILIGSVSSKHQAMSDRLRSLMAEWRNPQTTEPRRESIRAQVELFRRRIAWTARAHILLYAATACFLAMVPAIALTPVAASRRALSALSLPLLLCGVCLMLIAIVLELMELRKALATIGIESREAVHFT